MQPVALTIERDVYTALVRAARHAAPLEACGLCGGAAGHVTRFYELTNVDASPEHFGMQPEDQFAAVKDMRARGLTLLALWHSHPASPARMSDEDLRLAFTPGIVHLILSLAEPEHPDLRGYCVEQGHPVSAGIVVLPPALSQPADAKGDAAT